MDSKTFWSLVDEKRKELVEAHKERLALFKKTNDTDAFEGQPQDGSGLFTMTLRNPLDKNQEGDQVTCSPLRKAAQFMVENRHRVATHDEIKAFLKVSKDRYADDKRRNDQYNDKTNTTELVNAVTTLLEKARSQDHRAAESGKK